MPDWESCPERGFCFLSGQEEFIWEGELIMNVAKASPSATAGLIPNSKARLLDQVREVLRFHHYSLRTEEAYVQWIRRFLEFCRDHPHLTPALSPPSEGAEREKKWRHPREMGAAEVA